MAFNSASPIAVNLSFEAEIFHNKAIRVSTSRELMLAKFSPIYRGQAICRLGFELNAVRRWGIFCYANTRSKQSTVSCRVSNDYAVSTTNASGHFSNTLLIASLGLAHACNMHAAGSVPVREER